MFPEQFPIAVQDFLLEIGRSEDGIKSYIVTLMQDAFTSRECGAERSSFRRQVFFDGERNAEQ